MSGEYHGWDQEDDHWRFADVIGRPKNEFVFVIEDFGAQTTARQALSAIMSAMAQFQERVQVIQTDCNTRLIMKLREASLLRVAEITDGETKQWGILGATAKPPPPKKRFKWKFWAS
ncbi:hypothetical protein [Roseiconus lacunae]|uniref:Uncharacterized protein n=1 Tax=Roseiconus lacunae TaxID=2605694 RepID=A0ABT7PRV8_9BACT|nr:hypothetical protein [Roseiconus lacunae]MCD0458315.1 hypothetical protein [Roseiconus lacunae]MDM4019076.1 hypothetical protein [Roseiconus lacunae]WRQ52188.1 hypothetical protein U8335_06500 [Stieleria sp. HD01]